MRRARKFHNDSGIPRLTRVVPVLIQVGGRENIGDNAVMKYVVLSVVLVACCLAEQPAKPACKARNRGEFWPAAANTSPDAARRLANSGDLEICSLAGWKYKWEHLTVNVRNLGKGARTPSQLSQSTSAADHPEGTATAGSTR